MSRSARTPPRGIGPCDRMPTLMDGDPRDWNVLLTFAARPFEHFFFFFLMMRPPPRSPLFPSPTLFGSDRRSGSFRRKHRTYSALCKRLVQVSACGCRGALLVSAPLVGISAQRAVPILRRLFGHLQSGEIGRAHV